MLSSSNILSTKRLTRKQVEVNLFLIKNLIAPTLDKKKKKRNNY